MQIERLYEYINNREKSFKNFIEITTHRIDEA